MSVLERVQSGLNKLKVAEPQKQPSVRVVEGGGFAPLKVSETPLETPELTVTGAPPSPKPKSLLERVTASLVKMSPLLGQIKPLTEKLGIKPEETFLGRQQELSTLVAMKNKTPEQVQRQTELATEIGLNIGGMVGTLKAVGGKIAKEILPLAKSIPPELQPLAQEAKKYKSAEEFVRFSNKSREMIQEALAKVRPQLSKIRQKISNLLQPYKVTGSDLGLRNALIGNFNQTGSRQDFGVIFENFIISEVLKVNTYGQFGFKLNFWRTKQGSEIDLVLTKDNTVMAVKNQTIETINLRN